MSASLLVSNNVTLSITEVPKDYEKGGLLILPSRDYVLNWLSSKKRMKERGVIVNETGLLD